MISEAEESSDIEKEVETLVQETKEDINRPGKKLYDGNRQPAANYHNRVANLDEDHYEDQTYAASTEDMSSRVRRQWQTYDYNLPGQAACEADETTWQVLHVCNGNGLEKGHG